MESTCEIQCNSCCGSLTASMATSYFDACTTDTASAADAVEHPLHEFTPYSTIEPDPLSDSVIHQLQRWLHDCGDTHTCRNPTSVFPNRVLDVGSASDKALRLVCGLITSPGDKFIALSHCWGSSNTPRFILTTENEDELQENVPFDALPQTFQDAIHLCRRLDVRYLWIDSLCILQNDSRDWARESVRMHYIYRDAYLTIIAARAVSDHQGFLISRSESPDMQPVTTFDMFDHGKRVHVAAHILRRDLLWSRQPYKNGIGFVGDNQPISERAWVVQERYLSRRKVIFCHDQIFWECQEVTASEDGINFATSAFQVEQLWTAATGYSNWYKLISEYSFCHLTYESDVFPALTGLANSVLNSRAGTHKSCAGIWTDDIARGLTWKLKCHRTTMFQDKCSIRCKESRAFQKKTDEYQAPSFSWAAWRSGIGYDYVHDADLDTTASRPLSLVQYIDHHLEQIDPAAALAGPYKSGWLQLRGWLTPVLAYSPTSPITARQKLFQPTTDHETKDCMQFLCSRGDLNLTVYGAFDNSDAGATMPMHNTYILPLLKSRNRESEYLTFLILEERNGADGFKEFVRTGIGRSLVEAVLYTPQVPAAMTRPSSKRLLSEADPSDRNDVSGSHKRARSNFGEAVPQAITYEGIRTMSEWGAVKLGSVHFSEALSSHRKSQFYSSNTDSKGPCMFSPIIAEPLAIGLQSAIESMLNAPMEELRLI